MTGPILVTVDGSQLSEHALPLGVSLAQRLDTTLLLLRVLPIPQAAVEFASGRSISLPEQEEAMRFYANEYLREVAKRLEPSGASIATLVLFGYAGESIAKVADEKEAPYIVMSTHGRGGLSRWALGSVTDRVMHLSHRPLVILPPHAPSAEPEEPLPNLERIVVPLDGSDLAESTLVQAKALAHAYGAELLLFRTLPPLMMELTEAAIPPLEAGWWESVLNESREYLRQLQASIQAEGFRVRYEIGIEQPAEAILKFARDTQAGMIVMATHGREGVRRALLGSVTDRIVRSGQLPVVVVRPGGNNDKSAGGG